MPIDKLIPLPTVNRHGRAMVNLGVRGSGGGLLLGALNILGPRYAIRVGDLREWHVVHVRGTGCSHAGFVPAMLLIARWPVHERLSFLATRFRCSACGLRDDHSWQVERTPR